MALDCLTWIVNAINTDTNLNLSENEFCQFDKFIDDEIANGDIIKHSQYNFTGPGLADKINKRLSDSNSSYRIVSVPRTDSHVTTYIKGQGLYYLVRKQDIVERLMILCWASNAVTFFNP